MGNHRCSYGNIQLIRRCWRDKPHFVHDGAVHLAAARDRSKPKPRITALCFARQSERGPRQRLEGGRHRRGARVRSPTAVAFELPARAAVGGGGCGRARAAVSPAQPRRPPRLPHDAHLEEPRQSELLDFALLLRIRDLYKYISRFGAFTVSIRLNYCTSNY